MLVLGVCLGLALCGWADSEETPLDRVTLQLKWKHQFQFAGYYAALEQGFYREAGLAVRILQAGNMRSSTAMR